MKSKIIPYWFTTVNPLSKTIAFFLFLMLPLVGFCIGSAYQHTMDIIYLQKQTVIMPIEFKKITTLIVKLSDNGKITHAKVNDHIKLDLGSNFDWGINIKNQNLLSLVNANSEYNAINPGTITITAGGKPKCVKGQLCSRLVLFFTSTIVIDP